MADVKPEPEGCTFIMFRGAMTGRVITCGVCEWCRKTTATAEPSDTFEQLVEELEALAESVLRFQEAATSYRESLIFERLSLVQNAIDDWRQG